MMEAVEDASKLAEFMGARRLPHELKGDEPRGTSSSASTASNGLSTRQADPEAEEEPPPPPLTCRVSCKRFTAISLVWCGPSRMICS